MASSDAANLAEALVRNRAVTERMAAVAARSDDLVRIVHDNWTVAAKLAHLAYWDRFVLILLDRWQRRLPFRTDPPQWFDDVQNDAILDESLALEPAVAARLAVEAARAVDEWHAGLSAEDAARLDADARQSETDANWLVHRYRHREEHLDEVDAASASG